MLGRGIFGEGSAFTAQDLMKELKDVAKEANENPARKDQKIAIKRRADEIIEILTQAGVKADGLTILALAMISEKLVDHVYHAIELQELLNGLRGAIEGKEMKV